MQKLSKLTIQSIVGDLRRGGYSASGIITGDTDGVSKGANIRLMGRSGSKFLDHSFREIFNGHVLADPDPIAFDAYTSDVRVALGTMQELLMTVPIQDIGFTAQVTPLNDHQITGMTLAHIVQHILQRHNNSVFNATTMPDGVITNTDIDTTNSVPLERYNVSKSENLWRSIQNIGGGEERGEFYRAWFDRHNKFYYQPAPAFWGTPPTTRGTITKEHIWGKPKIKINNNDNKIGQVQITAIANHTTIYTSTYPTTPVEGKILPPRDGIFADTQAKTDTLAQRLFDWMTRPYTVEIMVDPGLVFFGDDGQGLDLANKVTFTYDGPTENATTGAGMHINFNAQDFFVYGIRVNFQTGRDIAFPTLLLEYDPT